MEASSEARSKKREVGHRSQRKKAEVKSDAN
jgi:hypothetical protein